MEQLIMLALPLVVTILTQGFKTLEAIRFSQNKVKALRFFALTLSFVGVLINSALNGDGFPVDQVSTYAEALLVFLASQVPYWYGKLNNRR